MGKRFKVTMTVLSATLLMSLPATIVQADIFQWEYVDSSDPSQGKRLSSTLVLDGAGVDAVPGAAIFNRDYPGPILLGQI